MGQNKIRHWSVGVPVAHTVITIKHNKKDLVEQDENVRASYNYSQCYLMFDR